MIEMICIRCPMGCHLKVDENNGYSVTGNTCPRGSEYGFEEATAPTRTVTSTVRILFARTAGNTYRDLPLVSYFDPDSGYIEARLPVKTRKPVAKDKIADVMKEINCVTVYAPVRIGDLIVSDIASTGSDLIATANSEILL